MAIIGEFKHCMNMFCDSTTLAIDGGGTHCRFALSRGQEIVTHTAASTNVHTDLASSIDTINMGLRALAKKAKIPLASLYKTTTFVGLAGLIDEWDASQLAALLPLENAIYADDRPAALKGALGDDNGAIAHSGTGSFFAIQVNGVQRFAGGWGSQLGDEASAMWMGRKALGTVLMHHDGFYPESTLITELLSHFDNIRGVLDFANDASPKSLGKLAPKVTQHANNHDAVAVSIMQEGARILTDGLDKLGWVAGMNICLTGGLAPHYYNYLPQVKQDCMIQPKGTPLEGAMAFARDITKGKSYASR